MGKHKHMQGCTEEFQTLKQEDTAPPLWFCVSLIIINLALNMHEPNHYIQSS